MLSVTEKGAQTIVTDGLGHETTYYFDAGRGAVTSIVGVCGCGSSGSETTTFTYDERLNVVKKADALSNESTYTYDVAVHALQDNESPAHTGFQEAWTNTTFDVLLNIWHYPEDTIFYGKDNWKRAENNTLRAWSYFKGAPLPSDFFSGTGNSQNCECPK